MELPKIEVADWLPNEIQAYMADHHGNVVMILFDGSVQHVRVTELTTRKESSMRIGFIKDKHRVDEQGRPAGGETVGTGFTISWQDGPLGRIGTEERTQPNGAFVEDVIAAAISRIEFYQNSGFACQENADALEHLREAAKRLDDRTKRRTEAATEGTHEGS